MIKREISQKILDLSEKFPVITVTGPRQSGKTTFLINLFGDLFYASLENPETRMFAIQDPKNFLQQYSNGGIIDEAQLVPELFSYIQGIVDQSGKTGQFILSGSQSFLLHDRISQSLAGRTAIFRLLPFSFPELRKAINCYLLMKQISVKIFPERIEYSALIRVKDTLQQGEGSSDVILK